MGAELNSRNFLSAVPLLAHRLDSCSQMALLPKEIGFSFLANGSNNHKNVEAHLQDYKLKQPFQSNSKQPFVFLPSQKRLHVNTDANVRDVRAANFGIFKHC